MAEQRKEFAMAIIFNRFEVQSELSKSDSATIYKALDQETNQVVALKTQNLAPLGDRASAFVDALVAEGLSTRNLAAQNIVPIYGAGEIDGQFSAAMEYIQGNSVATMLARNEGFSIWDILDISRQLCAGLEQAAAKGVAHSSFEPAKIMVQWDGMVKILGYGISKMSLIGAELGNGMGRLTPYCSPEQLRGEVVDSQSNLFSLGTILYEMVAGRRAFNASDTAALLSQIENDMPPSPTSLNPKILPSVSAVILKALAKDPATRYRDARELLDDLEKCKESGKKTVGEPKTITPPAGVAVDPAMRTSAANKFVSPGGPSDPDLTNPAQQKVSVSQASAARPAAQTPGRPAATSPASQVQLRAAAAAGVGAGMPAETVSTGANFGARQVTEFEVSSTASPSQVSLQEKSPIMVDPMMAESATAGSAAVRSFSDLAEMPPLKEPVYSAPVPERVEPSNTTVTIYPKKQVKPKMQPREVAGKAIKEISTVPPRLMLFAILGAVGLILVVAVALFLHVRSEDDGSTAAPHPIQATSSEKAVAPALARPSHTIPVVEENKPTISVRQPENRAAKKSKRTFAPAAVAVAQVGQALIDSDPQGAQIQIDGNSDPAWVTPFNVAGLSAGKHIISASKASYSADIHTLEVVAGAKATLTLHLTPMNAVISVSSNPAGAAVTLDGKATGKLTPTQFSTEKGSHTVALRKNGYLDESVTTDLAAGQNFQFAPTLKALGNVDNIKTVGKMNKLFSHGSESTAGMGAVSIHTQPKGAQVVINQRVLDKFSPLEIMLGPGNYAVDITLTGFKPLHKVVTVERGSKAAIDEILERQ